MGRQLVFIHTDLSKGMDMGHDIVTTPLFLSGRHTKILISDGEVCSHLLERLVADEIYAELLLAFCEIQPKLAPCAVPVAGTEQLLHLRGGVPAVELRGEAS